MFLILASGFGMVVHYPPFWLPDTAQDVLGPFSFPPRLCIPSFLFLVYRWPFPHFVCARLSLATFHSFPFRDGSSFFVSLLLQPGARLSLGLPLLSCFSPFPLRGGRFFPHWAVFRFSISP